MASLTKEELKTQLINNGIDLPPTSAKKEVFVALYEKHVASKQEFSADDDDDEIIIASKAKAPIYASENGDEGGEVDVESLDDSQLRDMLKENNIVAGPIVNSTRNLYKKKLIKVLGGSVEETEVTANGDEDFSDTEPEEVAEKEEDEPLDDTEPDSVHLSSEDEQPSGLSQPVTRKSPRSSTTSSKDLNKSSLSSKSFNMSGSLDANESLLRNRFGVDSPDSSLRYTPTARKAIHSYKVTEVTTMNFTKSRNGVETKNTTHTIERKESVGDNKVSEAKPSKIGKWIAISMIVVLVLAILYYVYLNHLQKGEPIKEMQEAIQNAVNKALGNDGDAPVEGVKTVGDDLSNTGEKATPDVPVDSGPKKPRLHV